MTDLSELFSRDPLSLAKQDIEEIIKAQRASRAQFALGNMKAGKTPAKPKTAAGKAAASLAEQIKLEL